MKILLCNDTGTKSHIGCQAVSDAHARLLGAQGHVVHHRYFVNALRDHRRKTLAETIATLESQQDVMSQLDACDAVIVNGEGTLHHNNGVELIALLALGQRRGKATLLVNALYQQMDFPVETLSKLDAFFVRDIKSQAYVEGLGIACRYAPDSIIAAKFHDHAREDFGGHIAVTDWVKARDTDVGATATQVMHNAPDQTPAFFFPLHSEVARVTWRSAPASLATAGAVVSGWYHGLYLAALAGVPFVPMASNSWKIDAFLKAWDVPLAPVNSYDALMGVLPELRAQQIPFQDIAARMASHLPLPIFDVLGQGSGATDAETEVQRLQDHIAAHPPALAADRRAIVKRRSRETAARLSMIEREDDAQGQSRLWRRIRKAVRALKE